MKLKVYHKNNTISSGGNDKPTITVRETGFLSFSGYLSKELKLEGKKVAFAEDEERAGDWYLILEHKEGFELTVGASYKKTKTLKIQNKALASKILSSLQKQKGLEDSNTITVPVAIKPVEGNHYTYALLTKGAFSNHRKKAEKKGKEARNE